MARVGKKGGDGGAFDDATGIHNVHMVAGLGDDSEVVGDEDDGGAQILLAFADEIEDLLLNGDVEGGGGLVGDEEFGLGDESHGNHDPLAHAAGEFMGVAVDAGFGIGDADFGEGFDGASARFVALDVEMESERLGELVHNLEVGIERGHGILEDHGDALASNGAQVFLVFSQEVDAVEECFAGVNFSRRFGDESEEGVAGDGFSRAGLSNDAESFTFLDGKGDVFDRVDNAVAGMKSGGEI